MRLATTLFAFSAAAVSALTSGGKEATKRLQVWDSGRRAEALREATGVYDRSMAAPFINPLVLGRTGGHEICRAADTAGLMNGCVMVSTWTDPNPNGLLGFVPSAIIVVWGDLWHMNWPLGMYVNNYKGESGTSGNGIEYLRPSTVCGIHFLTNNTTAYAVTPMDPDPTSAQLIHERGNAHAVIPAAVAGATLYGEDGLEWIDVTDHPSGDCCAPTDGVITRRAGASKGHAPPSRPRLLPTSVPTAGVAGQQLLDCNHHRTNVWMYEADTTDIYLADFYYDKTWIFAMVVLKYMVGFFEAGIAAARPYVLAGHGDAALHARFSRLQLDFDPANPVYSKTMTKFMNKVKGRKLDLPLRWALVRIGKILHAKILHDRASTAHPPRRAFTAGTLANIASFLPDRAHNFPFTKRVGPEKGKEKFVTPPVEWLAADGTKVADATQIAALKTPEGDVFPSATAVALDVAKLFPS